MEGPPGLVVVSGAADAPPPATGACGGGPAPSGDGGDGGGGPAPSGGCTGAEGRTRHSATLAAPRGCRRCPGERGHSGGASTRFAAGGPACPFGPAGRAGAERSAGGVRCARAVARHVPAGGLCRGVPRACGEGSGFDEDPGPCADRWCPLRLHPEFSGNQQRPLSDAVGPSRRGEGGAPAGAPAAAADRKQRPGATCEGTSG